jgi:hypothetical protein
MRFAWLLSIVALVGCGGAHKPNDEDGTYDDNGGYVTPLPDPLEASTIEDDSGALSVGDRQNDGGVASDAGHTVVADDASAPEACTGPIGVGDVKIVEMMIASVSGSGDRGEWIELQNTRDCILNVNGLSIQSPRGNSTDTATIATDVLVAPGGAFVVADSASSTDNHDLPTAAVVATFDDYDVLKNSGDTINVYAAATLVDTLTYPSLAITAGRSLAFPADCAWSDRTSFARWSMSFNVWSSPYEGTPGADNTDVSCY